MNVVFSGNRKVLRGIEMSILSILENTKKSHHFYIMTMDLDFLGEKGRGIHEEDLSTLKKVVKDYNKDNEVTILDVQKDYYDILYNSNYRDTHYTPYTFARLFIDKYIKEDKAVYLDADTLCYQNFDAFDEVDLTNSEAAVVKDALGEFWIHRKYFNGGVLILNLKYCREHDVFPKVIHNLLTHRMYFGEQSAMFNTFKNPVYLSKDFNEQRKVKETTIIKHFCQGIIWLPFFRVYNIKQWQVDDLHKILKMHEFDEFFKKYEQLFNVTL